MDLVIRIVFFICLFIIVWAMIGYPLSLKLLKKVYRKRELIKDYTMQPTVTIMIVAHNEEKVILKKLENVMQLDYPKEKTEIIVASDNSTDNTNQYVNEFIDNNKSDNIRLFEVKERKGKTNAQNEAHKIVNTDFLVMTDANSILDKNSVSELMSAFTTDHISYVTGRLVLVNKDNDIGGAESSYWDSDLTIREIESRIQTITAGNGALYACRTNEYFDFDPIQSHDSAMPFYFAMKGRRAIANHDAIAYEKAGETIEDEFGRKVRMNRRIIEKIMPNIKLINVYRYKWFSYFYFGHRTCRYLLWISHVLLLISNGLLIKGSLPYSLVFVSQIFF